MNILRTRNYNKKNDQIRKKNDQTRKLKKMNCSPIVKNITIKKNSCYTPLVLNQIKNAYNESHPSNKILTEEPHEIWNELNEKLSHCDKEDCWLEEIKDTKLKNDIDKYIFAPDYPKIWDKNPNEWLSNYDILHVLRQYEKKYPNFIFLGPSSINFDEKVAEYNYECVEKDLCTFSLEHNIELKKNKIGIIFNLSEHDEEGSHWVSLFIDVQNKFIFYFDSNGEPIPEEIKILKDRVIEQGKSLQKPIYFKYYDNYNKEHQKGNTECGMYSLFFIITLLTDSTEFKKKMSMKDKLTLFKKKRIPDKYVEKYRKIYFNSS